MSSGSTDCQQQHRPEWGQAVCLFALTGSLVVTLVLAAAAAGQPMPHGRERGSDAKPAQELVQSVHHGLRCMACHGPGPMMWRSRAVDPVATCGRCHQQEWHDYASDAHESAHAAGGADAPTCVACHGSHAVRSSADLASATHATNVPGSCGACHEQALASYRSGVHGEALLEGGQTGSATCTNCHGAHGVGGPYDPGARVWRGKVAETCGTCHFEAFAAYRTSVHGRVIGRGNVYAATCVDCHGAHAILAPGVPQSPLSKLRLAGETCARCHEALRLTEMHHLPRAVVSDFRGSVHGLAGALGDRRVANCASCHSYHAILPSSDPLSSVNPANLGNTCGTCHPGAGPQFARGGVHHLPRTFGHRLVDVVRSMYRMMIVVVIGLMATHNAIDFRKRWQEVRTRRRERQQHRSTTEEGTVLRFTLNEQIQHWVLAASFLVLVFTGFALKFGWGLPLVEGEAWSVIRGWLHRAAAVVFMALAVYHVGYLFFTARGRGFFRAMIPRLRSLRDCTCCVGACFRLGPPSTADWRELVQTVQYNLGLAARRPRFGRFTYAEKMEYLALVWGSVVMVGSGLILWFEEPFLNRFPYWGFELATAVHYYEAILATLAIVVWHFYFTMFNPDVFPLSPVMITGRMTLEEMEREHPRELEEMRLRAPSAAEHPRAEDSR